MELFSKKELMPKELPDLKTIVAEGKKVAAATTIGTTLFMKEHNIRSEVDYKRECMKNGRIMRHSNLGWNSWAETKKGAEYIYQELKRNGMVIDRFGFILDWIMGVPQELRHKVPKGTGLVFGNADEWKEIGQIVPVQPHFGDHMIGSLNSVENVKFALAAGVTTIGNLSHFFTYEYPGLSDQETRIVDMIKAVTVMAEFRNQGALVHSNLDDGYGAQFYDIASTTGWAMLENYMVDKVLGAKVAHCFGNLFTDASARLIFARILDEVHGHDSMGSMIYGNTLDYTTDCDSNIAVLSSYLTADIAGQLHQPTGHAVVPIPVTEASRIPSPAEVVQAHIISHAVEAKARDMVPLINWEYIELQKERNVVAGRVFFERVMNALDDSGIDITNPGEVFLAIKRIGAAKMEEYFGAGQKDSYALRGRIPVTSTCVIKEIQQKQAAVKKKIQVQGNMLDKVKVVVAATDVHEFAKEIVVALLREAGATVYDLGSSVAPREIAAAVVETDSRIIAVSTYNGIALTFTRELLAALKESDLDTPILMGGLLNENQEGSSLAVDVSEKLSEMGITCCPGADMVITEIRSKIN